MECCRLRMKDIDLERGQLTIRGGKGDKDRYVMLPRGVAESLRLRMQWRRELHAQDLARGFGRVEMPTALAAKFPRLSGHRAFFGGTCAPPLTSLPSAYLEPLPLPRLSSVSQGDGKNQIAGPCLPHYAIPRYALVGPFPEFSPVFPSLGRCAQVAIVAAAPAGTLLQIVA